MSSAVTDADDKQADALIVTLFITDVPDHATSLHELMWMRGVAPLIPLRREKEDLLWQRSRWGRLTGRGRYEIVDRRGILDADLERCRL